MKTTAKIAHKHKLSGSSKVDGEKDYDDMAALMDEDADSAMGMKAMKGTASVKPKPKQKALTDMQSAIEELPMSASEKKRV